MERFGLTRSAMIEGICRHLTEDRAGLLRRNFRAMERDPLTVAAVAALTHLKDKFCWGILPPTCWAEVMGTPAAQLACAVSGSYQSLAAWRQKLAPDAEDCSNAAFTDLACRALALGFTAKWENLER